jgi:hypothetical protein
MVFGLPFLMLTDLFPFHRYGMFALIPEKSDKVEHFCFETRVSNQAWQKLQTGNLYFDNSYLPVLAEKGYRIPNETEKWILKLRSVPAEKPDSIRIVRTSGKTISLKSVYP